jgi:kinesin family member C2/C3
MVTFFAQHIACLLKKVLLEIERRMSTQAEHIRNVSISILLISQIIHVLIITCMQQNNLMRAREEKYKSRIRVLEALASGANGQVNSSVTNGKTHVNFGDFILLRVPVYS